MQGQHEYLSFRGMRSPLPLDLTIDENYDWMDALKSYSWKQDHDKRSNSLTVHMEQLTNRMSFLNATLDNAIIEDRLEPQAELAIKLLMTYAENDLMLDSTTLDEITAMRKKGSYKRCYQGKGNVKAVCHAHTAQEAARFAGQLTIAALKVKPFMDEASAAIIDDYLKTLYRKYSKPWQRAHNGKWKDKNANGFYQMANGGFNVLAYAAYTNDKNLAFKTFDDTHRFIDRILLGNGLIINNSFRGVRGYWYHTLGLNNILGYVALAHQWGYPIESDLMKRISSAVDQMALGAKDLDAYHAQWLPKFNKKTYRLIYQGKNIYVGNSSLDEKDARYFVHQQAPFIDHLSARYTGADSSFFNERIHGVMVWNYKKREAYYDRTLGFNPHCIPSN